MLSGATSSASPMVSSPRVFCVALYVPTSLALGSRKKEKGRKKGWRWAWWPERSSLPWHDAPSEGALGSGDVGGHTSLSLRDRNRLFGALESPRG
eukprot:scaffold17048_cov77-Isochrysis_galbana.AAC.1